MTRDREEREQNTGECLPLAAFPEMIFVSRIEIPLSGEEPHSYYGLICYASGSSDTSLNLDKIQTFWGEKALKSAGTLKPFLYLC